MEIIAWWDNWRRTHKLASRFVEAAGWILGVVPGLLALAGFTGCGWFTIVLSIAGVFILIAVFVSDFTTAKKQKMQLFWAPWIMVFLFAILTASGSILWWHKTAADANKILQLNGTIRIRGDEILKLRQVVNLTPEEETQLDKAMAAWTKGTLYRDKPDWSNAAHAFEEAYTMTIPVALKHADYCRIAGKYARNIAGAYHALGRRDEAEAAQAASELLVNYLNKDLTIDPSSPAIKPAIVLYNKLTSKAESNK